MKKNLLLLFAVCCWFITNAQTNYLDNYIGNTVTPTVIASSINQVNQPRDLDFKPNSNELWVVNYGTASGGTNVIFYNAGLTNQSSQYRKDTHTSHFMRYPSAMAFGDDGKWSAVSEYQSTNGGTSTFMGPGLWLSDTSIFARVFQNNWLSGYPLGSHVDMLHQSPFSMGIAHDTAMEYWVMDGWNGNICKYDFVQDHGPGYDNHSNGKIWRYIDVPVTRVPQIPSHMVLDKVNGWLYFIDGGSKKIKRLDTNTGKVTGNLIVPSTAQEGLASYKKVEGAMVEVLDSLTTQPCGMDYYNGRLIVSDYATGDIYLYNTTGTVSLTGTIVTGHPGMMGVKVGPDGHIWCVNYTESKVYRLDVIMPTLDVSIVNVTSPVVENYLPNFFSTAFNVCDGNITPTVEIANTGSTTITGMQIDYMIDGGIQTVYNWTGSLASGSSTSVTLPPNSMISSGNHRIDVMIVMVNGMADDVDLNNTSTGSFRVINPPAILPFTEGFATTTFPPAGWNYIHFNPNNKMSRVTAGGFGTSVGSMKMDNYSGNENITGQKDFLMFPVIDFTSASPNTYLLFNVAYAKYSVSSNDALQVVASTDCGNTWTSVYNKSGTVLSTAPVTTGAFTPSATQWRTDTANLSAFAGQSEVLLMFTTISNFGNNLYVDDIFVGTVNVGVEEVLSANAVSAYPNPASDNITFAFADNRTDNLKAEIFSADGKLINSLILPASENKMQIDLSGYSNGIYAISLSDGKSVANKKFVKQ